MNTRLVRNIAWNVGAQLTLLVLSLTLLRTVFRGVGGDAVGLLYFSVLISNLTASLSEVGLAPALVREVSGHLARDRAYAVSTLRTFSTLYWALFAALAAGLVLLAPDIAHGWLHATAPTAAAEVRLLGVGALLALPRSLYLNMLRAIQRLDVSSRIEMSTAIVQQLGGLVVLAGGGGRSGLVWWWSASFGAGLLLAIAGARTHLPAGSLRLGWSRAVIGRNVAYTTRTLSVGFISLAQTHLDKVMLSRGSPLPLLGAYGYAFGFVARGTFFAQAVGQAALPALSEQHAAGNALELRTLTRKVHDLICYGSLPGFAAVPFLAMPLFGAVFDVPVARALHLPLTLLAIAFYLSASLQSLAAVSLATGRVDIALRFNVYAILVAVPLTFVLVRRFGLVGAAWSWIAYYAMALAYSLPRLVRECLDERALDWYARLGLVLAAGGAAYGPGLWAAGRYSFALAPTLLAYAASTGAFALIAWRLMGPGPRSWVATHLRDRLGAPA